MGDEPHEVEAFLMARYAGSSLQRAREQFSWPYVPLIMFWAPIRLFAGAVFELMPDGLKPRKRDWHWVIAARTGSFSIESTTVARWLSAPELDRIANARDPLDAINARTRAENARLNSQCGEWVHDFVACTPDLLQVRGTLFDRIDMLGNPQEPDDAVDPVRVHATPLGWLSSGCTGVVPVGREHGVQQWLRECEAGLVADSVAHGEALMMKMRREVPKLPRVLVVA